MRFLIEPTHKDWVAIQDRVVGTNLKELVLGNDLCISDLDDCIAPSPAKKLAYGSLVSRRVFDRRFISWSARTAYRLKTEEDRQKVESETWKEFIELFLIDPKELARIEKYYSENNYQRTKTSLFPGVEKFYQLLHQEGVYAVNFTRNIQQVADVYRTVLGINESFGEAFDKEERLVQFLDSHPNFKSVLLVDDVYGQTVAERMLNVLESRQEEGKLEKYVSVLINPHPNKLNSNFTINMQEYSGLVDLIG